MRNHQSHKLPKTDDRDGGILIAGVGTDDKSKTGPASAISQRL